MSEKNFRMSKQYLERALRVIPSGNQTFSKGYTQLAQGTQPFYASRASGGRFWDVDGNEYIDFVLALGPMILGYAHPKVDAAVMEQIRQGTLFSLPHPIEVEVAELLTRLIPCAEMVRFGKNGSDVTAGAVRVARAYTRRDVVAVCGYHGWQDWYIGTTYRHRGVPESVRGLSKTFEYNQIESLESLFRAHEGQIAAVVMEALGVVEPKPGFLEQVRELCTKNGALLVFDEVVTGFRFGLGGIQEQLKVIPDLACFGKAMANGYPLSAVVGKKQFMREFDRVFFSFTFGGETASLAACRATIEVMQTEPVFETIRTRGECLLQGIREAVSRHDLNGHVSVMGQPQRFVVGFKGEDSQGDLSLTLRTLFQQELGKRGIHTIGIFNVCYAHTEPMIRQTVTAIDEVFGVISVALKSEKVRHQLMGPAVQPVFRKP